MMQKMQEKLKQANERIKKQQMLLSESVASCTILYAQLASLGGNTTISIKRRNKKR